MQQTSLKIDEVIKSFSEESASDIKILFINGEFGTGKSEFLRTLKKEFFINIKTDALFRLDDFSEIDFLPELMCKLKDNCRLPQNDRISLPECDYHLSYFYGLLNKLNDQNIEDLHEILKQLRLKNKFDLYRIDANADVQNTLLHDLIDNHIFGELTKSYFQDIHSICSEAFLVDLISLFYSFDELIELCKAPQKIVPTRIYFVIDNYDTQAGSIDRWLNSSFFPYCFNKTLHEFKYYDNTGINNIKISTLLDFRFILSGRFDYDKELKAEFGFNNVRSHVIRFEGLSNDNFDKMIEKDISSAATQFLSGFSAQQNDWLINASFLDDLDLIALRCMPGVAQNFKNAYNFFKRSPLLIENNKFKTNYKKLLTEYLKVTDSDKYHKLSSIAEKCKEYIELEKQLGSETFELLRPLGYFTNFDQHYALDQFFLKEADNIRTLIKSNNDIFEEHEFSLSLKNNIKNSFDELNRIFDKDTYELTRQRLIKISESRNKAIESEINDKKIKINNIQKRIEQYKIDLQVKKLEFPQLQNKLIEMDNSISDEPEIKSYRTERSRKLMFTGFAITFLFAFLGLFTKDFFSAFFEHESSVELLSFFLFLFATMALTFSVVLLMKRRGKLFANNEVNERTARREELKNQKESLFNDTINLKKEIKILEKNIIEFEERIKELEHSISLNKRKLTESYI